MELILWTLDQGRIEAGELKHLESETVILQYQHVQ